ncbi:MAG: tyrosine-type recombinase/integrase, partial [Parcubacteria group bacterium]|nr:tyrosine-type recombinase/integrase [Parcubacteria group bacterium]
SLNEINSLLKSIDDFRDRAIVTLFLNTGLFLNELTDLKIDSIDWNKKILKISGSRKRELPLIDQAYEALAKWSKERPDVRTTAFFITTKGKVNPLSARSVDHLIRKYADQAGIKRKVNAQILRNTFAVRLFKEEVSIDKATAILGITDTESINRYVQASKQPPSQSIREHVDLSTEALAKVDTRPWITRFIDNIFPTKPKQAKKLSEIKGPIIPNPEEIIYGRDKVIENLKSNLTKGQSILLMAPLGMGKTHTLKHMAKLLGPNTLYLPSPSPTRIMLNQICDKLNPECLPAEASAKAGRNQVKTRATTREIAEYIVNAKGNKPPMLIVDNLQNLRVSDVDPFLALIENFTILASTDETKDKLKQVWWKFKHTELKALSDQSARELIKYLTHNLSISDYELLETRVMTLSNKLPLAIVDMIHQIAYKPVVNRDSVREMYHEAGIKYRDWTSVIVVIWGIAIMFRFLALGTHSFEGYILAGFGMAILAVTRFLLFRMR